MSIERRIIERINESRRIHESEFQSGGSEYKCVFGRYYKDDKEISRDDYFKAKDKIIGDSGKSTSKENKPMHKPYEEYTTEEFDKELDSIEGDIESISYELSDVNYDKREEYNEELDDLANRLAHMEEYLSEEQYDRYNDILDALDKAKDTDYDGDEPSYNPYDPKNMYN